MRMRWNPNERGQLWLANEVGWIESGVCRCVLGEYLHQCGVPDTLLMYESGDEFRNPITLDEAHATIDALPESARWVFDLDDSFDEETETDFRLTLSEDAEEIAAINDRTSIVGGKRQWNGVMRTVPEHLADPLRWKKPRMVFVNSMSDLFHEGLPFEEIAAVFGVMAACPRHTFQVLTKRLERAVEFFRWLEFARGSFDTGETLALPTDPLLGCIVQAERRLDRAMADRLMTGYQSARVWPPKNVWLGASVENQKYANQRIRHLLLAPAAVRFLSCEPLLGPVDLTQVVIDGSLTVDVLRGAFEIPGLRQIPLAPPASIDWVIVGGESGPGARPMRTDWARAVREQCRSAETPFFFKQHGAWATPNQLPATTTASGMCAYPFDDGLAYYNVGKKKAGRELDGKIWDQMPEAA